MPRSHPCYAEAASGRDARTLRLSVRLLVFRSSALTQPFMLLLLRVSEAVTLSMAFFLSPFLAFFFFFFLYSPEDPSEVRCRWFHVGCDAYLHRYVQSLRLLPFPLFPTSRSSVAAISGSSFPCEVFFSLFAQYFCDCAPSLPRIPGRSRHAPLLSITALLLRCRAANAARIGAPCFVRRDMQRRCEEAIAHPRAIYDTAG